MQNATEPGPYAVFDFGGTNLRGGIYHPSRGESELIWQVEVPPPVRESEAGTAPTAQQRIGAALDEVFAHVALGARERGVKVRAASAASRGAFKNVRGQLWWVPRSLPTMEFSPGLIKHTSHQAKLDDPTLTGRALNAAALVVPTFPLQATVSRLAHRHLGLLQEVPIVQDAAANLMAEIAHAERDGSLDRGKQPSLLILGTGIGFAVVDQDGQPVLDRDGHGPAISRLVVDAESGLTLTAATNGPALEQTFGRKASVGDREMIDHAVRYLTPIVAEQMTGHGANVLITTGGVADALGSDFNSALESALETRGVEAEVRAGALGQTVGLNGAGAYAANLDLRGTPTRTQTLSEGLSR